MKRHAPATERNREPILGVLRDVLPAEGTVLEVASGSGEHAVYFAAQFPRLVWQPTDVDLVSLESIRAWKDESGLPNLRNPLIFDVTKMSPVERADAIVCINMVHISPWSATVGLFAHAATLLAPGAVLFLYGPYIIDGRETAPSNLVFDEWLRSQDPAWGVRNLTAVQDVATQKGFALDRLVDMPANNVSVVFRKL
jgi:hypothetical protein